MACRIFGAKSLPEQILDVLLIIEPSGTNLTETLGIKT